MSDLFSQLTFWVAISSGAASIISVLVSVAVYKKRRNEIIDKVQESKLEEVLDSSDIKKLGKYMDDSLSDVSVSQYTSSSSVSDRVDRYLSRIQEFVGTTDEIKRESERLEDDGSGNLPRTLDQFSDLDPELKKVLDELETGEEWNALARLRRHIEIALRDIALDKGELDEDERTSAGQLLRLLSNNNVIAKSTASNLDYAISVSNRAVHGVDVEPGEAEEAVYHAFVALKELNTHNPRQS